MAAKVKTWVWIVAAVFVVGILGIVALAAVSFYYFSQHIETRDASALTAGREFQEIRDRFSGQKPLIELDDRGRLVRTNPDRPAQKTPRRPEQLNVLAFEPDDGPEGRLVRVTIPFWLLRLKSGNARIDLNEGRMDLEDLKISVEDLERYGPTLLVDHKSSSGQRVLVWSQ
jgi:hypothetical protein